MTLLKTKPVFFEGEKYEPNNKKYPPDKPVVVKKEKQEKERKQVKSNNPAEFEKVMEVICLRQGVSAEQIESKSRKREFVIARNLLWYFTHTFCTFKFMGINTGNKDHSSVIHGVRSISNDIETDKEFRILVESIAYDLKYRPENASVTVDQEMKENYAIYKEIA